VSGTVLERPSVQDYLRDLNLALRGVPPIKARALREQIAAHLDEALPPDADDEEISAVLNRLGSPADLAAEAVAAAAGPVADVRGSTWLWYRLARVHRVSWILAALVVILAGTGAGYLHHYLSAGPLTADPLNDAAWAYPQDVRHEVNASLNNTFQSTVPIRSGQRQGYILGIYNPTNVTETIVGSASGPTIGWNAPWGYHEQLTVSTRQQHIANGFAVTGVPFAPAGSIPPFQTRLVRVTWISQICLGKGESSGTDQQLLYLRVRVGWFTRTEIIPLNQVWFLVGPSHGRCI
jgi:hypothetical protein